MICDTVQTAELSMRNLIMNAIVLFWKNNGWNNEVIEKKDQSEDEI